MLLEIYDIEPLKSFFDLIYNSTTDVELKLDQEKLSISLLNNSHVCFYNAEYRREFFGEYVVDDIESVLIYVEDFYKILKSAHNRDILTIRTNESYLICTFEHDNNRRVFELPLADGEYASATPPAIDYDDEFNINLEDLRQPCIDLDKIVKTDRFKMITGNGVLNIIAPNDSMTRYSQEIPIDYSLDVACTVNLQYILDLQRLSKINKEVVISMGDNLPLTWNITSADELVNISGLIAPIIEQED